MRAILYLLQKEFIQIFRNKTMLPIIFIMPLMQMLILVFAATEELKEVKMVVMDGDHSQASQQLIHKLEGSGFFKLQQMVATDQEAEKVLQTNQAELALIIPPKFSASVTREGTTDMQILIDAINGVRAEMIQAYVQNVITDFSMEIGPYSKAQSRIDLKIEPRFWYNKELDYKHYMAPGILVILVTVIGMFLTSINVVREKEMGTIEQLNVTPIKKHQFIIGKLVPFWLIALFDLFFGLAIAAIVLNLPFRGSIPLLALYGGLYLLIVLGIGLFISTHSQTQQQVLFVSFFIMVVFVLMSGLFTPVESMPLWAQYLNLLNPMYYFVRVMRSIVLKGSTFGDLQGEFWSLLVYGTAMLTLAINRYKKTT